MAINFSDVISSLNNELPVEGTEHFAGVNRGLGQVVANAAANTVETQVAANMQKLEVTQKQNEAAMSVLLEAQAKSADAFVRYSENFDPRREDYNMLSSRRRAIASQLVEEETDPKKNNIITSPFATIASMWRSKQLREQNNALGREMNELNREMREASQSFVGEQDRINQDLQFAVQTEVNLKHANARAAAEVASTNAQLRYTGNQTANQTALAALQSVKTVSQQSIAMAQQNEAPRDALEMYMSLKTGSDLAVIPDAQLESVKRAFQSESAEVRAAVFQSNLKYRAAQSAGLGSTEQPLSFALRELSTSNDGAYAQSLDLVTGGQFAEIAQTGVSVRVKQIADSYASRGMAGMSEADKANPALMQALKQTETIASRAEQEQIIGSALMQNSSFKDNLNRGLEFLKEDFANAVSDQGPADARPFVSPAKMSTALDNPQLLLSYLDPRDLQGKSTIQVDAAAAVALKSAGVDGGNLMSHKLLAASKFLKDELGINSDLRRNAILHKWLQASLQAKYRREGMYSGMMDSAAEYSAHNGEEFGVELWTRPTKEYSSIFGRRVAEMPSFNLGTEIGFANYMLAIEHAGAGGVSAETEQSRYDLARKALVAATGVVGPLPVLVADRALPRTPSGAPTQD